MCTPRLLALGIVTLTLLPPLDANDGDWLPLFNGKNLDGWDTWLGKPYMGKDVVGLNIDPKGVYSVVMLDGKPAIRISGEIFGALTSKKEYENYHLRLEFKWGEKKWPPRVNSVRDSGLLYHCVGEHGAAGTFWMRSQECQIQEKDCGDYWSVAGGTVDVEAEVVGGHLKYKKGGTKVTVPRVVKTADGKTRNDPYIQKSETNEKEGAWNTIELLTVRPTSVYVVNGKVVMVLTNSRQIINGKEEPLIKGRIQIQSEGAEVFYRNIEFQPLARIPEMFMK
jgi:Domain of Unknown Function (DUF1080)